MRITFDLQGKNYRIIMEMGIGGKNTGRKDIYVKEKKFCGNRIDFIMHCDKCGDFCAEK